MNDDRWPAGRPAAPTSAFHWRSAEASNWEALENHSRSRIAASKAEATKRRNRTSTGTIYGLSRASDELVLVQATPRRVA